MRRPRQRYQGRLGGSPASFTRTDSIAAPKPAGFATSESRRFAADGRDIESVARDAKALQDARAAAGLRRARAAHAKAHHPGPVSKPTDLEVKQSLLDMWASPHRVKGRRR